MRNDLPLSALTKLIAELEEEEASYVVGGSTGLVLRGANLDRPPRDLDVYVDEDAVRPVHERLRSYALDGPEDNETEKYHSTLSHYRIEGTMVELVGHFRVYARQSVYTTEVNGFLYPNCDIIEFDGVKVPVIPLGHELIFNVLRERHDRAEAAGKLISQDPDKHMPLLKELIRRNRLSEQIAAETLALAGARMFDPQEEQ
ncbi:nucleotidyltransferase domain-containing protein [Cohnella terricola]|nr:hypothetical protein [Cohnella terricola]